MPRLRTLLCLLAAVLGAADLRAQAISYVSDIVLPSDIQFVLPLNGRNSGQTGIHVMSVTSLYTWDAIADGRPYDPTATTVSIEVGQFPAAFKINSGTLVAYGNLADAPGSMLRVLGVRNSLYAYSTVDNSFSSIGVPVTITFGATMLSYVNASTMVLSTSHDADRFYTISPLLGLGNTTPTPMGIGQVTNVGGTAFGPDGRLYVLDHPNGTYRVQSFDIGAGVADADRLKSSFTIAASLTSGYAGMAINSSGHLFIADGLGGGTAYDLAGNHLGDFSFTSGGSTTARGGASYLNVDDAGNIFVYTPENGLHRYFDASYGAIPEPATSAVMAAVVSLGVALWRRRRAA